MSFSKHYFSVASFSTSELLPCYNPHMFETNVRILAQLGGSSQLGYVVNNHDDRKSPKDRAVVPLPNGLSKWLANGGDPNHLQFREDDPPRTLIKSG